MVSLLVLSMVCGVLFAFLATWLHTKKGNTISDILRSQKFADAQAIRVEIEGQVKIASNVPIVALYIVGAVMVIAPLGFTLWLQLKDVTTITLSGSVKNINPKRKVYVRPVDMWIQESGAFKLPLIYRDDPQSVNIEGEGYHSMTLEISINKLEKKVSVQITTAGPDSEWVEAVVPLVDGKRASVETAISLSSKVSQETDPANSPSEKKPIRPELRNVPPIGVASEPPH